MKNVTWQGKYTEEFESFWGIFFKPGISLNELSKRFVYAIDHSYVGPLSSWFTWLRDKFICYTFINKGVNLRELSREVGMDIQELSRVLRNFLVEVFPQNENYFNEKFIIVNNVSENCYLTADKVAEDINEDLDFSGTHDEEIMRAMEVTLYEDWSVFLRKMHKDFSSKVLDIDDVKTKDSFKKTFISFANAFAILGISVFLFWLLEFANKKYESYLSEKISIYEPQFRWENKGLKFNEVQDNSKQLAPFELDIEDIEDIDDTESLLGEALEDQERTNVESEVVLTSLDSLPKDINIADSEKSEYEEEARRGYRDTRYGNTKVYRVMMRSSDTVTVRNAIKSLIDKYNVTKVDNVKPGLAVPGGFYYNLYVPRSYLKEFMLQVQETATAVIYESKTRTRRNPPGKNKVFIWLKSI
jgi:hypothetical protein